MCSPLCICNGVIRSGSTWSFNVCRELFDLLGQQISHPCMSGYMEANQVDQFINQQWPTLQNPVVIKAHDMGTATIGALRAGKAKAVCTYRDPRDCVASDMTFMGYPFEISLKRVGSTLEPLRMFQSTANILLVRYESMMANPKNEIRRIALHLGLTADQAVIDQVDSKTNIDASQRLCQSLSKRSSNQVLRLQDHIIDPTTHLHQNHINGGTVGRWKSELTTDQISYMTEFFSPWLTKLGYETDESLRAILDGHLPPPPQTPMGSTWHFNNSQKNTSLQSHLQAG